MILRLSLVGAVLLAAGCSQPNSPAKEKPDKASSNAAPSAQIVTPEWVAVSKNSANEQLYVNLKSIFRYKDGPLTMAEIAVDQTAERKKQKGYVLAFNCKDRLFAQIATDGDVSEPAPVVTWNVHADLFNYVCFRTIRPDYINVPHVSSLDVETPQP